MWLHEGDMPLIKESLAMAAKGDRWVGLSALWVHLGASGPLYVTPLVQAIRESKEAQRLKTGDVRLPPYRLLPFAWNGEERCAFVLGGEYYVRQSDGEALGMGLGSSYRYRHSGKRIEKPYFDMSETAAAVGMLPTGAFAKWWERAKDAVKQQTREAVETGDYGRLSPFRGTVAIGGETLRVEAHIDPAYGSGSYIGRMSLGIHEGDMERLKHLVGAEHQIAGKDMFSGREVVGMLGIEPVRLQGSALWLAYQKGTQEAMEALPEAYRGLAMRAARWGGSVKTPSLFAEDSALAALCRYFHVVNPQEKDAYLRKEQVAKALDVRAESRLFTGAWEAFSRAAFHAVDGQPVKAGRHEVQVGIERRGTMKEPLLHKESLGAFERAMDEGISASVASSIAISASGKTGRRR